MEEKNIIYSLKLREDSEWLFVTPSIPTDEMPIYLQEIGDFFSEEDVYTERGGIPSYQIYIQLYGKMSVEYRGKEYILAPGDIYWINCLDFYRVRRPKNVASNQHWHVMFIHFFGDKLGRFYETFYTNNGNSPVLIEPPSTMVKEYINQLLSLYKYGGSISKDFKASEIFFSLMNELISLVPIKENHKEDYYIDKTIKYLNNNYTVQPNLDDIAKEVNVSKYHLCRTFKKNIGISIGSYLTKLRINKAKELLKQTNLSINEICWAVGMATPSFFIKEFKILQRMTPAEYRKQWRLIDNKPNR